MKKLRCFLDGNALCIVDEGFVDIQESPCMFLELTDEQIAEYKNVEESK